MNPPFEEVLGDLLANSTGLYTADEIISAMELQLMALKEEANRATDD